MELNEFKKQYIQTTRIEFENDYVELREPTTAEFNILQKEKDQLKALLDMLPSLVVGHSFTNNGVKATNLDVVKVLSESGVSIADAFEVYFESLKQKKTAKTSSKK